MSTKELTRPKAADLTQQQVSQAPQRFSPFDVLQREIDNVFDRFNGFGAWPTIFRAPWPTAFAGNVFSPNMEITETDNAVEVTTELPGMDEKDIEIGVADGVLTIRGEKKIEKDEKKRNYRLVERSYGSFERAVALPPGVDASKVKAKMAKGILKVEVPKPASAKAQPIKIAVE